ncbi:MAG: response regulator transcription factor [Bacteroidales bacterium]|nr:response regulator transcription factor [Bacteroidales bacterium]
MTENQPKILYVEDDPQLAFVTRDNLEVKGYKIVLCKTGQEALDAFQHNGFDLCILDVMLPGIDGFSIARKFRKMNHDIPILFLSAKSMKEDRLEGFTSGGDDYITKPYSIEELIFKIEVFLKRNRITGENRTASGIFRIGSYIFDYYNMQLRIGGKTKRLTSREAELLLFLNKNRNKVLKKEEILKEVWDSDSYFNSRSLDVFVSKLRKHLADDQAVKINNVHGIGFIMVVA